MGQLNRKRFLQIGAGAFVSAAAAIWLWPRKHIPVFLHDSFSAIAHLLRDPKKLSEISKVTKDTQLHEIDVLIIGGGISGLTAARKLHQNNIPFQLLELGNKVGGNAVGGNNEISEYPWGAHYLPIPNLLQPELLKFLEEHKIIVGYDDLGKPIYNDYYLCSDPEERLYIHHYWQEGLIPDLGMKENDHSDIQRFLSLVQHYKMAIGSDRKQAFCIPIAYCSKDEEYRKLEAITFENWLTEQRLESTYLLWYLNYCCKDDYGTSLKNTSAWAGIHYFAARKGVASNAGEDDVLTWPEGNQFLVHALQNRINQNIQTNAFVSKVSQMPDKRFSVYYTQTDNNTSHVVLCKQVLMATPQFVNQKILSTDLYSSKLNLLYSPWLVANISTMPLSESNGVALSWDNVIFNSESLGYVNACHQQLKSSLPKLVLTYYLPFTQNEPKEDRKFLFNKTVEELKEIVLSDLEKSHKDIRLKVIQIDLKIWGHAMVGPRPNTLFNPNKQKLLEAKNGLHFAHSDLSGISIFEEAFYQGNRVADEIIKTWKA